MSSVCISNCVKDTRVPVRATYVNLYKWPESDAEFVKTVGASDGHPRVVDSISCRQMYLRSYTFSRKETVPEKTKKCLGRVRERVVVVAHGRKRAVTGRRRQCVVARRVKEVSWAALCAMFQRLLSCSASVDVVDH
ncbi:unnamed protein product [Ilex paraguariensis]|uniref:Uncharacterized protein n=1 Tax=Ilex paraguariensis TaxID=185542 RepID=A0ABC8RRN2_9AQUA